MEISFQSHIHRKGIRTVSIDSDPIWSSRLQLWFVWTRCAAWKERRPWHMDELPKEVQDKINAARPDSGKDKP